MNNAAKAPLGWIDAHCHLADPRLMPHLDDILLRAKAQGINGFIQGGVGPEDWLRQLELAKRIQGFWPCLGLHPWWVASHTEDECLHALERLEGLLDQSIGLGELGLDHGLRCPADTHGRQLSIFKLQLEIAARRKKPLVLHIVKAHALAIQHLKESLPVELGGIVHSYSGDEHEAKHYLDLGLSLSVGGPLVRKGFGKLKRAMVTVALDRIVLETDSPDQPPPSHAGLNQAGAKSHGLPDSGPGDRQRLNEPATLIEVAEALAKLKPSLTAKDCLEQSRQNLIRIFGLRAE